MIVIWAVALTTIVNFLTSIWTIFSGPSKRNAAALAEQAQTLARLPWARMAILRGYFEAVVGGRAGN
ncbi:MAG: hypothetical protein KBF78_14210 [Fuscovulum sp.]|nr:hypothetical protein [Fuscovulum sp.]